MVQGEELVVFPLSFPNGGDDDHDHGYDHDHDHDHENQKRKMVYLRKFSLGRGQ